MKAGRKRLRSSRMAWSAREDAVLRAEWGEVGMRRLCSKFRHPFRTWYAIHDHATKSLGLKTGIPQGHVSISEAARRTGYVHKTLLKILRRHGVKVRHHPFRFARTAADSNIHWSIVEWDDVVEAVAKDLKYETVFAAARRSGICDVTLRGWLRDENLIPSPVYGNRTPARVLTADIDRVIAEHAPPNIPNRERMIDAACRHSMDRTVLRRWLIAANLYPNRTVHSRQPIWLDPRLVDQVVASRQPKQKEKKTCKRSRTVSSVASASR